MSTVRRVFSILASHREGTDAIAYVALIALTAFTAAAGIMFVIALVLAMEPGA